jgi:hypothetical protein
VAKILRIKVLAEQPLRGQAVLTFQPPPLPAKLQVQYIHNANMIIASVICTQCKGSEVARLLSQDRVHGSIFGRATWGDALPSYMVIRIIEGS